MSKQNNFGPHPFHSLLDLLSNTFNHSAQFSPSLEQKVKTSSFGEELTERISLTETAIEQDDIKQISELLVNKYNTSTEQLAQLSDEDKVQLLQDENLKAQQEYEVHMRGIEQEYQRLEEMAKNTSSFSGQTILKP